MWKQSRKTAVNKIKKQWENNDSENMVSYEKETWEKSVRKYIVKDEKRVGEKWAPIRDWLHEEPSAYYNLPPHIFGETSSKNSSSYFWHDIVKKIRIIFLVNHSQKNILHIFGETSSKKSFPHFWWAIFNISSKNSSLYSFCPLPLYKSILDMRTSFE